jgi:hypothetical protein
MNDHSQRWRPPRRGAGSVQQIETGAVVEAPVKVDSLDLGVKAFKQF